MTRRRGRDPSDKLAWFKMSPTALLGDIGLAQCSPGANGVWVRMICTMALSEEYGVLVKAGVPMTPAEIAKCVGWSRRTVKPFLAELARNGVYSVDSRGAVYCRRMVREYRAHIANVANGKKGGNPAVKAARGHNSASTRAPVEVQSRSSGGRVDRDTTSNEQTKTLIISKIEENRVNPRVKAESESESESEISKKEGTPAESSRASRGARPAAVSGGNVVGLREGQPLPVAADPPAQPALNLPPTPVKAPRKQPAGPVMRAGFERIAPKGDPAANADAQTALDAWNALARMLGMHVAGMSRERRTRIVAILREFGGLDAWRLALVKVEESDYWSGRSGHPHKPTLKDFTTPEKFRTLLEDGYADRIGSGRGRERAGAGPDRPGPLDAVYDKYAAQAAAAAR